MEISNSFADVETEAQGHQAPVVLFTIFFTPCGVLRGAIPREDGQLAAQPGGRMSDTDLSFLSPQERAQGVARKGPADGGPGPPGKAAETRLGSEVWTS